MRLAVTDVIRRRLATQRLVGLGLDTGTDVVALLCCVQSQEHAHALWSLGMRSELDEAALRAEFDRGDFLRTHILRPTWHFVSAADIGWVLRATSPRVQQLNAGIYRQYDLEAAERDRTAGVLVDLLGNGAALTRPQLAAALAEHGLEATGTRLAYIVMNAELEGLVCSGPMRGAQHTYALLSERVAGRAAPDPEHPLAELLRRYIVGHGPTTVEDFARWASRTLTDSRTALEVIRDELCSADVDGLTVWWHPSAPDPCDDRGRAWLVPLYDELTLSYPKINFSQLAGHPHASGEDLFIGSVIVDTHNVGLWRRTVKGSTVVVEINLARRVSTATAAAVDAEAERLATFLGKELVRG